MRNLIPVLMLVMSATAMAFAPVNNGREAGSISHKDSVRIKEQYRAHFMKALESVFGPKAVNFAYTATGNLIYKGDTTFSSPEEREIFKKLSRIMTTDTITNVIYERRYVAKSKLGKKFPIRPRKYGGEGSLLTKIDPIISENYIVINPDYKRRITVCEVTNHYYEFQKTDKTKKPNGNMFNKNRNVKVNPMEGTWHGLGHAIYAGHPLDNVIDFDNLARKAYKEKNRDSTFKSVPMALRRPDWTHNRTKIFHDSKDPDRYLNDLWFR